MVKIEDMKKCDKTYVYNNLPQLQLVRLFLLIKDSKFKLVNFANGKYSKSEYTFDLKGISSLNELTFTNYNARLYDSDFMTQETEYSCSIKSIKTNLCVPITSICGCTQDWDDLHLTVKLRGRSFIKCDDDIDFDNWCGITTVRKSDYVAIDKYGNMYMTLVIPIKGTSLTEDNIPQTTMDAIYPLVDYNDLLFKFRCVEQNSSIEAFVVLLLLESLPYYLSMCMLFNLEFMANKLGVPTSINTYYKTTGEIKNLLRKCLKHEKQYLINTRNEQMHELNMLFNDDSVTSVSDDHIKDLDERLELCDYFLKWINRVSFTRSNILCGYNLRVLINVFDFLSIKFTPIVAYEDYKKNRMLLSAFKEETLERVFKFLIGIELK